SFPSTMSLVIPFSFDPSCAPRRLPELRGRQALPAEGVVARAVAPQVLEPLDRFPHRWCVPNRHPPHHEVGAVELLEPLVATAVEALVYRLPDVSLERLDGRPDRHVDRHPRIVRIGPIVGGVAARILQPPDELF